VAYDLLNSTSTLSPSEISEGMSAVLCRCTGYWNILKAVEDVATSSNRGIPGDSRPAETGAPSS